MQFENIIQYIDDITDNESLHKFIYKLKPNVQTQVLL